MHFLLSYWQNFAKLYQSSKPCQYLYTKDPKEIPVCLFFVFLIKESRSFMCMFSFVWLVCRTASWKKWFDKCKTASFFAAEGNMVALFRINWYFSNVSLNQMPKEGYGRTVRVGNFRFFFIASFLIFGFESWLNSPCTSGCDDGNVISRLFCRFDLIFSLTCLYCFS